MESRMKLLVVSRYDWSARAINTLVNYARAGRALGHEIALFSSPIDGLPDVPTSLDPKAFDAVMFVVYETPDFPDLPYLAHLVDGVPRERRILVDCTGRYNDTIAVELDFNHLEKMDNHMGWEWVDGFDAVARIVLQPTLTPRRSSARGFLFHGFNPAAVERPFASAEEAARSWIGQPADSKPYGLVYVGNNWQRWSQMRWLLTALKPIKERIGPVCLTGWAWDYRPDWAAELGIDGINTDPAMLWEMGVAIKSNIPFTDVVPFVSQARFAPVIHRPLFNHLGLVTNRTFETFCSDTVPLLMLPDQMIDAIYGPAARVLAVGDDPAAHVQDVLARPDVYWDAILKTRAHLAERHSFTSRVRELAAIAQG
jgi:hypothetical protein